ncbi:Alsin [Eumeta japonica]|uniref:Alsin n=1 Tax=Eumeta variegata TaxID=151549 RepID=A0A4C1WPB4_EUMVA|nr:Alsin [Eumeta japonica]
MDFEEAENTDGQLWGSGVMPQICLDTSNIKKIQFFEGRTVYSASVGSSFAAVIVRKKIHQSENCDTDSDNEDEEVFASNCSQCQNIIRLASPASIPSISDTCPLGIQINNSSDESSSTTAPQTDAHVDAQSFTEDSSPSSDESKVVKPGLVHTINCEIDSNNESKITNGVLIENDKESEDSDTNTDKDSKACSERINNIFMNSDAARQFLSKQLQWVSVGEDYLVEYTEKPTRIIKENVSNLTNFVYEGVKTVGDKVATLSRHVSGSSDNNETVELQTRINTEEISSLIYNCTSTLHLDDYSISTGSSDKNLANHQNEHSINIIKLGKNVLSTELWTWGETKYGQLGIEYTAAPVKPTLLISFKWVSDQLPTNKQKNNKKTSEAVVALALVQPLTRLSSYRCIAQSLIRHQARKMKENSTSHIDDKLNKALSSIDLMMDEQEKKRKEAEATKQFWEMSGKTLEQYRSPERLLIRESKSKPLNLVHSGRFATHRFILFNDFFLHISGSTQNVHKLETLWVEALSNSDSMQNVIQLTTPEEVISVSTNSEQEKTEWIHAFNSAISMILRKPINFKPPTTRTASYTFTNKSQFYKDAKYHGRWLDGKIHGSGKVEWPDSRVYVGQFQNNTLCGYGKMIIPGVGTYEGQWKDNLQNGYGVMKYTSGDIYEGYFKDGLPHGHGVKRQGDFNSSTATIYMGEWANGVKHGYGLMNDIGKGEKYLGNWSDNKKHGCGLIVTLDGIYYEGLFMQDVLTACDSTNHPLGPLILGLMNAFNATYGGVRVHPLLLSHAVKELKCMTSRLYHIVRLLFPALPPEGADLVLPYNSSDDIAKDTVFNDGVTHIEGEVVSPATLIQPLILPRVQPALFVLYALHNKKEDDLYWRRLLKWNRNTDQALLTLLGVDQKFWAAFENGNNEHSQTEEKEHMFREAAETLQQLKTTFSPTEKLSVIKNTFQKMTAAVQLELGSNYLWSMDELFPVFHFVVIRARVLQLGSEVHFIEDFIEPGVQNGELGLMFTTLKACYFQILQEKLPIN